MMIYDEGCESLSFTLTKALSREGMVWRYRRNANNENIVKACAHEPQLITLYMPVIAYGAYYYNISLCKEIAGVLPDVCLLSDGLLNIRRYEQDKIREFSKMFRKFSRLVAPLLNYYFFKGSIT